LRRTRPVIIHIHIPRCGGTSFRTALAKQFGAHHVNLYVDDTDFVYGERELEELISNPNIWSASSHFIRNFPQILGGRRVLYATFLRDPLTQFISYRSYICKAYSFIQDRHLLAYLPPRADRLSSREFTRWVLCESPQHAPFRENYTTNFLTYSIQRDAFASDTEYYDQRLETAKNRLRQFFFTGLTEGMEQAFPVFALAATAHGLLLHPDIVPFENSSREFTDDMSWIRPDDEVGALLLASVGQDQELYRWAQEQFAAARGISVVEA
jgi:hypothetical protein